jgi:hypothetical protein
VPTETPTATATPTVTPTPVTLPVTELGCQTKDNESGGGTSLTVTAPSGQVANNLLVLAVSELGDANVVQDAGNPGGGATAFTLLEDITVPAPAATFLDWSATTGFAGGAIINPTVGNTSNDYFFTQSGCTSGSTEPTWTTSAPNLGNTVTDGTCTWINEGVAAYRQLYYVHEISSTDVNDLGTPAYTFDFQDNLSNLMAVRAQAVITSWDQTCLNESVSPCANAAAAILEHTSGSVADSTSIPSTNPSGETITTTKGAAVVGAFGSDRDNPLHASNLQQDACGDFTNGGLDMAYSHNELGSTAGPFTGMVQPVVDEGYGTTDGSVGPFTYTVANPPIQAGSATLSLFDGSTLTQIAVDNGSGAWTSAFGSGTINYQTGAMSFTFTVAPMSGDILEVSYQDLGDNIGNILSILPQVGP